MDKVDQPGLPRALRPYVIETQGYHAEGVRAYEHVALPTPALVVVIDLAEGLLLHGLGNDASVRFGISAAGVCSEPARVHEGGTSHGVMVYLTPLGARAMLGLPAAQLVNQAIELSDVLGPAASQLREAMQEAGDWACLDVLHGWLLRRLPQHRPESVGLEAWDCIMAGAAYRVATLAAETGWSARYLHAEMRKEIGLSPRTLLSVKRFAESVEDVRRGRNLAGVAARHGYADASHLTREWHRFTGLSPTGWRENERASDPSAGIQEAFTSGISGV